MRRQLLLSTVGITFVALLLLGVPLSYLLDRVVTDSARFHLQRQAQSLELAIEPHLVSGRLPSPERLEHLIPRGDRAIVHVAGQGQVAVGTLPDGPVLAERASSLPGTTVTLQTSSKPVEERVQRAVLVLIGVASTGLAAAAVLAAVQARKLAQPLERLARASLRLGGGDFSTPLSRSGLAEIDAVADALETTSRQVAAMMEAERQFSANASHQLRSALTSLSLQLQDLAAAPDPDTSQAAATALEHVDRLSQTITDLLRLARTGRTAQRRSFDASALIHHHLEDWQPAFSQAGRALAVSIPPAVSVTGSPGALGQAFDVLISNALRHGAGTVSVGLRPVGGAVDVIVSDQGQGLDAAIQEGLFSRSVSPDGHGIGLALARALVESDGATLELRDPASATFRIRLSGAAMDAAKP